MVRISSYVVTDDQYPLVNEAKLQGEVFVLRHNFIDEADATEFYPSMKLNDCIQKQAIELLNFRIMIDPEFNIMP